MNFLRAIRQVFLIKELRERVRLTVFMLFVHRLGSYIVLPGLDPDRLSGSVKGIGTLLDSFLGGAFSRASILGLGIMPYISASIVVQLLTLTVPSFQKMQREGKSGRDKLSNITRILAIFICIGQSIAYLNRGPALAAVVGGKLSFTIISVFILTGGTVFSMWLGEKITEGGVGNGASLLISVSIISALPAALLGEVVNKGTQGMLFLLIEFVAIFFVIMLLVMFTQAVRRIPLQYAKQIIGGGLQGGARRQYLPLKLNASGVMPIIFASTLMYLVVLLIEFIKSDHRYLLYVRRTFSDPTTWGYSIVFSLLIFVFTIVYTAITVNSVQIADDLKRNGGFIPGVKPGQPTATYIDELLNRITFPGAFFLAFIALLPAFAFMLGVTREFSRFCGGSSMLIIVGVLLDTVQQIESYLLMRHYEGMMKSGKVGKY